MDQPTAFLVPFQSILLLHTDFVGFVFSAINFSCKRKRPFAVPAKSPDALRTFIRCTTIFYGTSHFFWQMLRVRKGRLFIVCWQGFGWFVIFGPTFIRLIEIRQQLITRRACTNKYKCDECSFETINRLGWRSIHLRNICITIRNFRSAINLPGWKVCLIQTQSCQIQITIQIRAMFQMFWVSRQQAEMSHSTFRLTTRLVSCQWD